MIKLVNVVGIEFKAWIVKNDVQLFKELEQEGFELEVKQTDDPKWYGSIMIANLPCPLIEGYIVAKSYDDNIIDYFVDPNLTKNELNAIGKEYARI